MSDKSVFNTDVISGKSIITGKNSKYNVGRFFGRCGISSFEKLQVVLAEADLEDDECFAAGEGVIMEDGEIAPLGDGDIATHVVVDNGNPALYTYRLADGTKPDCAFQLYFKGKVPVIPVGDGYNDERNVFENMLAKPGIKKDEILKYDEDGLTLTQADTADDVGLFRAIEDEHDGVVSVVRFYKVISE